VALVFFEWDPVMSSKKLDLNNSGA